MVGHPVRLFAVAIALARVPLLASGQEHDVIPLVPAANWHLVSSEPMAVEATRRFGADPAIEREYGVKTVVLRKYHLDSKQAEVLLEEAYDPSAAYGLLTYYRTEEMKPARGMEVTVIGPSGAAMVRGRFFIRAWPVPGSDVSENQLRALLIAIGGTRPTRQDAAALPAPLPSAGLTPGSEKYLLGLEAARRALPSFRTDLIGFTQGAEAQVGTYSQGLARLTVLAISYPTPQIARIRFGAMENMLEINQERGAASIYGRRTGSTVILVLDAANSKAAQKLIDQFQVTSNVSWNEPAPQQERFIVDVIRMVLAILLLAFLIAGFAVGGGLILFLTRRLANRFFPQWEWADPERERIIRLNLR